MKRNISLAIATGFLAVVLATQGAETLTQQLQHGLFEEEANQNIDAAIKAYQSVVTQAEQERKVVATALFRLGECYRKLGKTNEANAQFERVLRDFSDQEQLAKVARERVGTRPTVPWSGPGIPTQEESILAATKKLLKESPDLVNSRDPSGGQSDTRLHTAVRNGHTSVAEFLLANGANVNAQNASRQTPLHVAASAGNKAMVELLLANGADVNRTDNARGGGTEYGGTALYRAAEQGYRAVVELLLKHKADLKAPADSEGYQALHIAAKNGFAGICELLLDHGAEIGQPSKWSQRAMALHLAAGNGHREVVEVLLKRKADVNSTDFNGNPPLDWAAKSSHADVVKLLLEASANPNLQDHNGESPLMGVSNTDVMKLLLDHKADPNLKSRSGATALSELIRLGRPLAAVELLLDRGADPNVPLIGSPANVPLIFNAVGTQNSRLVELLLDHRANPNVLLSGETPLSKAQWYLKQYASSTKAEDLAPRLEWERIEKLLVDHGADRDLHRLASISFRRPGWTTATPLFTRTVFFGQGAEDYNRYTLFEFIASLYARTRTGSPRPEPPAFPDLAHITVTRLNPSRVIQVDIADWSKREHTCSEDIVLEWGDTITIPEQDHRVNFPWHGLGGKVRQLLIQCMTRSVQIIIKGETNTFTLAPPLSRPLDEGEQDATNYGGAQGRPEQVLSVFRLNQVVYGSGLLRTSSDLTKVRVTRVPSAPNQPPSPPKQEWTIDLTSLRPEEKGPIHNIGQGQDLWLRDGDVIEIPDKP